MLISKAYGLRPVTYLLEKIKSQVLAILPPQIAPKVTSITKNTFIANILHFSQA